MKVENLICAKCGKACMLTARIENDIVVNVEGESCEKGSIFAKEVATLEKRILNYFIKIVKDDEDFMIINRITSDKEIHKDLITNCMDEIRKVKLDKPIEEGQIVINNLHNLGVNMISLGHIVKPKKTSIQ